ncbi:hypothetical protein [Streptomyces sp. SP18CS02]|uniref:hypothetical protein n=1 Tax=Streptomyces sp. SP18CS02 TaxID=3002531 RepID=UPI002E7A8941|nr:hypothetical protein [Streptomyces sp. SP18CS02]MEE1753420.1 hypothetical protein [Streptomyces sp. SP18CS02]
MRTRIRRGAAVALTTSALVLTAACGGSSETDAKPEKSGSSAKAGDPAKGEDAAKDGQSATPLTAAQMKAGVLAVADLPKGWTASKNPADDSAYKADKAECQPIATLLQNKVAGATIGANEDFAGGDGANQLSHQIMTFPGTGAADFVTSIGTAAEKCTGFKTTMEGVPAELKVEKLNPPKAGEESHGVRVSMDLGGEMEFALHFAVARQGTGVSRVVLVPGTPASAKDFDDLAKRAGDKFAKGVQG